MPSLQIEKIICWENYPYSILICNIPSNFSVWLHILYQSTIEVAMSPFHPKNNKNSMVYGVFLYFGSLNGKLIEYINQFERLEGHCKLGDKSEGDKCRFPNMFLNYKALTLAIHIYRQVKTAYAFVSPYNLMTLEY